MKSRITYIINMYAKMAENGENGMSKRQTLLRDTSTSQLWSGIIVIILKGL